MAEPRIGILVVAYNAETTLDWVFDRIPHDFRSRISAVLVSDDHSQDDTHAVGLALVDRHPDLPITVVRQRRNLGYGGNQKFGYRWAIEQGLDVIVLLHGDGQYAPEVLPDMVAPLGDHPDGADVVLGSRMMHRGGARQGGMPLYKFVGNRILTTVQNRLTDLDLSEWHSGYRAFKVPFLAAITLDECSDGFDFDTEVLLHLHEAGARIREIPIPTYYGDEISHVNGMRYAYDVVADVLRYRANQIGFGAGTFGPEPEGYEPVVEETSSHGRLLEWAGSRPPRDRRRALDVGCADGAMSMALRALGYHVVGVDSHQAATIEERTDRFVAADLEAGLPDDVLADGPYDVIVAADVLEHLRDPAQLLSQFHQALAPTGSILVSVPNVEHWYVRARVLAGRFDYDRRGILDRGHLRFFTRRSLHRLARSAGWRVTRTSATGLPFGVVDRGGRTGAGALLRRLVGWFDATGVRAWPNLFAYQWLVELDSNRPSS